MVVQTHIMLVFSQGRWHAKPANAGCFLKTARWTGDTRHSLVLQEQGGGTQPRSARDRTEARRASEAQQSRAERGCFSMLRMINKFKKWRLSASKSLASSDFLMAPRIIVNFP